MTLPVDFPTLPSLDLFVSVVELGSVGRAARAHSISQPSASSRLDDLERRLGLELLERGPTGSSPTAAGSLVAGWATTVLAAAHELSSGAEALRSVAAGEVRVIASYTIAEYLLPAWLGRYQRSHPETVVELAVANSVDVLDAIRHDQAELGFVESVDVVTGLASAVVGSDELVAVVAPDHPWAGRAAIDAATLVGVPLIAREHGSGTRGAFESAVAAAGLERPVAALELGSTS
ncbi:MAG: LysR family transcriptional regulator, partial [Ilumatobacteraceae bacterium]